MNAVSFIHPVFSQYTTRLEVTLRRLEQMPDEELLRSTEALLRKHVGKYPALDAGRLSSDPKRLFEETIPKCHQSELFKVVIVVAPAEAEVLTVKLYSDRLLV